MGSLNDFLQYNTLIVLAGVSLLGACAGMVGGFAVLRRRALTGDALAHAALPGLCLAVLLIRERNLSWMLVGAFATGVVGLGIIAALRRYTRVKDDAAIGIVLSVFFGLGIVLSSYIQHRAIADSRAGLDSYILGHTASMSTQDVMQIGGVSLVCLLLVVLLYKEFLLISFDGDFARTQGWPAWLLDWLLMSLIAVTVVVGLPAVGVVMMASLLIIPAAAARFWTDRLDRLLGLSVLIGTLTGMIGTFLSALVYDLPAGPIITLVGASLFLFSVVFAPRRGILGRYLMHRRFRSTLAERKLLRVVYELTEGDRPVQAAQLERERVWQPGELTRLLNGGVHQGWLEELTPEEYRLTPRGRAEAIPVVQDYRFCDRFLREHGDLNHLIDPLADESPMTQVPNDLREGVIKALRQEGRWPEERSSP